MKKQWLALFGILPVMAVAQPGKYSITGKIGHYGSPAKVYFDHFDDGVSKSDSAILVDGAFTFSGVTANYSAARMAFNRDGTGKDRAIYGGGDVIYIYIGNEAMTITSRDSLSNAVIGGSKVNEEYDAYNKFIGGTIMQLTKNVNAAFSAGTPEQQKDTAFTNAVDRQYRENISNRADKQIEFAKAHPDAFFSVVALSEAGGTKGALAVEPAYNTLNEKWKATDAGKELTLRIEAAHTIVMGATAPSFTQTDFKGNIVSLQDKRGKYLLVEFWASWCGPCRAENPNLLEQYRKYKDKGFDILSISLDDDRKKWATAIEKDALPWTHLSDLKGWNNEVGRAYGVRAVPASFLIDPTGKIIGIGLRGDALNEKLATLFN